MPSDLLLGCEAVAVAAVDAGIGGAFSYPGTPATEVLETVIAAVEAGEPVWARWSANEKVAYEEALGMSYAGLRSIVSMKHVGLNVAADPFINSALTGVNGGLVVVVADDPGMHSSQNEQDTRYYADFAKVPLFEPGTQQEAYDMTREGFELSERLQLPVMLRLVTRLAHSRSNVTRWETDERERRGRPLPTGDPSSWTLVPVNARRRFRRLLDLQPSVRDASEHSPHNVLRLAGPRGIVGAGIGFNYVREALRGSEEDSLLKVGAYPLPVSLFRDLVSHCEELVIVEEGYPFIETRLNGLLGLPGKAVRGKLTGLLPPDGELTPEIVATALGDPPEAAPPEQGVAARPPQLCKGCPHADTFLVIMDAVAGFPHPALFSDIGCYTLGAMHPFKAVHTCVDMGASVSMGHGASRAGLHPVICTIGDSTFCHSGMTSLLGPIRSDANFTVVILDNATVAMTGAQETMATGEQLMSILRGLGVRDLHQIDPLRKHQEENVATVRKAIAHRGLSVVVSHRPCIQLRPAKPATEEANRGA